MWSTTSGHASICVDESFESSDWLLSNLLVAVTIHFQFFYHIWIISPAGLTFRPGVANFSEFGGGEKSHIYDAR